MVVPAPASTGSTGTGSFVQAAGASRPFCLERGGSEAAQVASVPYPRAVHFDELTPPEQRVLGCLIEKRWTTPDQYPLSLNGLRLACNQSTNRDPVTDYDEPTVREAAQRLCRYGLGRLASGHASRSIKYRHLAEEALGLDREQLAVLAVLLLRGPQTLGELKARSERMARLDSLADVERVLEVLGEHRYAQRLERRPGQKEDRFAHLFGGQGEGFSDSGSDLGAGVTAAPTDLVAAAAALEGDLGAGVTAPATDLVARVAALEADLAAVEADLAARVAALEDDLAALRRELGAQRDE
jgi:uncharacterized protein